MKELPEESATQSPKEPKESAENAKYTVNVEKYAHYEDNGEVYSQEMQRSLTYAAKSPIGRFVHDFFLLLIRPGAFWQQQNEHPATLLQLHFPHLAILVLLRMIAVFVGGFLIPTSDLTTVIIQSVTQGFLIFVLVWCFAVIIAGITAITGKGFHIDRGLRFAGYSITPILFTGIIAFIPVPYLATIFDLLAMPWAFVVLGAGILPYLNVKSDRAPIVSALLCGILMFLWAVLPMLIPHLVGLEFWRS